MLLFRDLIRLFACYNDAIINLLEKYFDMNKKQCRDALDLYKKFLTRMDRVGEFLKVAEVSVSLSARLFLVLSLQTFLILLNFAIIFLVKISFLHRKSIMIHEIQSIPPILIHFCTFRTSASTKATFQT